MEAGSICSALVCSQRVSATGVVSASNGWPPSATSVLGELAQRQVCVAGSRMLLDEDLETSVPAAFT
ncbi:MAG TPA: hypothetical protein VE441_16540, partial [Mycobacterium sp.]|nr:hypothetical protein [Mycobacterium sp.]